MEFRTSIQIRPAERPIALTDESLFIGSCFSVNIGQKMQASKFACMVNPFGTLFHPLSIFSLLEKCLSGAGLDQELFLKKEEEEWAHFLLHSSQNGQSKEQLSASFAEKAAEIQQLLSKPSLLFITLGTAWGHVHTESGKLVANCHKVPATKFSKTLSTNSELLGAFDKLMQRLHKDSRVILSLSPVRHTREGLENNAISKAILRLFCHEAKEKYPQVDYFPAYEILIDDLRDYRFMESDLVHPNQSAIAYLWEQFALRYFSTETKAFLAKWESIQKGIEHKPFSLYSSSYIAHVKQLIHKVQAIKEVPCHKELLYLQELLAKISLKP